MAFISGVQVIDAPASALNNSGADPNSTNENAIAVKYMRVNGKRYPYVSAQAYRNWLRRTLEAFGPVEWPYAPIFREKKVAYTDANPIEYCDDDLFGYMRAPGKKIEAADSRAEMVGHTETKETITRVSPFRAGTLVGFSDAITSDFGTMSRHEGDPVPHEHQFYRTSLKGMFSVDLGSSGKFTYVNRTGFLNLDAVRRKLAEERGLEPVEEEQAFKLSMDKRIRRVSTLLKAMPVITGGAKQALHYTDVSPVVIVACVTKGGNNPFQYAINGDNDGQAQVNLEALKEIAEVWGDTLLSPLYIGWVKGYADANRSKLENVLEDLNAMYDRNGGVVLSHPKVVLETLAQSLKPAWF